MQKSTKEITLVVYDYDNCIAMRHTGGQNEPHDYEHPYTAILRARQQLQQHCRRLQESNRVIQAIGTYGEFKPRIDAACKYLGVEGTPLLSHCEYVHTKYKTTQGKNKHIYEILKQYYKTNACGPRITKVYLLDDDWDNVFACGGYSIYLSETLGITDERYLVTVKGFPVTKPMLEKSSVFLDGKMVERYVTKRDEEFETDVFVESKATESLFLKTLETLETKLLAKPTDKRLYNSADNLAFFRDLSSGDTPSDLSLESSPLTRNCGFEERQSLEEEEQQSDSLRSSGTNILV